MKNDFASDSDVSKSDSDDLAYNPPKIPIRIRKIIHRYR